jgi:hypothetical protein
MSFLNRYSSRNWFGYVTGRSCLVDRGFCGLGWEDIVLCSSKIAGYDKGIIFSKDISFESTL